MRRTLEGCRPRVRTVAPALLACMACLLSTGCHHAEYDSWVRTTGTPLGEGGEPTVETGRLWLEGFMWPSTRADVRLRDDGRRVWDEKQVTECEQLIQRTLARSEPWRSAIAADKTYPSYPVTAFLVSTQPAVVVVVHIKQPRRTYLVGELLRKSPDVFAQFRGRIGDFMLANSHVPASELAAVYLPELRIGPIPLTRGQSMCFPTLEGGVCLSTQDDGWTATWITPAPLPERWQDRIKGEENTR